MDSEPALCFILNGNLKDVVDGSKSVLIAGNNEGEVGILIEFFAVNVLGAEVRETQ